MPREVKIAHTHAHRPIFHRRISIQVIGVLKQVKVLDIHAILGTLDLNLFLLEVLELKVSLSNGHMLRVELAMPRPW